MKNVFAERFKAERELAGLTQDDIAEVCKNRNGEAMSRAAVAQWEDPDGTKPTFENLIAAAQRIGASIDYLVGLTERRKSDLRIGLVAETMAEYHSLSSAALTLAKQWQNLPPSARDAIQNLIDVFKKISNSKHGKDFTR